MILDAITWTASPILVGGSLEVRWYGLFFAIGFIVGYIIMERMFRHERLNTKWLESMFFLVVLLAIIGARLGHCLFYEPEYYLHHPAEIFMIWEGGLASHGGALGGLLAIWIFSRRVSHKSMVWALDRLVVPVSLVNGLIRLGNLMNHEIYGSPTDMPWGFRFIGNVESYAYGADPRFTPVVHPTQLYEALCYFLIFGLLCYMYWKRNAQQRKGLLLGIFLVGTFVARFLIEMIKVDQEAFDMGIALNMGQLLSIPFIVAGIWFIVKAKNHPKVSPVEKSNPE